MPCLVVLSRPRCRRGGSVDDRCSGRRWGVSSWRWWPGSRLFRLTSGTKRRDAVPQLGGISRGPHRVSVIRIACERTRAWNAPSRTSWWASWRSAWRSVCSCMEGASATRNCVRHSRLRRQEDEDQRAGRQNQCRCIAPMNSVVVRNPERSPMTLSMPHLGHRAVWPCPSRFSSIQSTISVDGKREQQ